ncbi:MAG: hypothetical protein K9J06_04315 [Flavobacteriales bacterium]|nr:hypothetical protein [Flavobacteriales bacterium]
MNTRPTAEYNCTTAQLYVIARTCWNSHRDNQQSFEDFNTTYTAQNTQDALAEIDAAAALPMFQSRNEATESTYVGMQAAARLGLKQWKYLRNYIRASYIKDLRKAKWESAGRDRYDKATNNNWGELLLMLDAGKSFIASNGVELAAGGMPANFPQQYNDARNTFILLHTDFLDFGQDELEGTDAKTLANNAVYRRMMDMNEDGQLVFDEEPAKAQRFVFQSVKDMITHQGGGGEQPLPGTELKVTGVMSEALTGSPLPNRAVNLTLMLPDGPLQRQVMTSALGVYLLEEKELPANTSFDLVTKVNEPGFMPYSSTMGVTSGASYSEDIELTPEAPPPGA